MTIFYEVVKVVALKGRFIPPSARFKVAALKGRFKVKIEFRYDRVWFVMTISLFTFGDGFFSGASVPLPKNPFTPGVFASWRFHCFFKKGWHIVNVNFVRLANFVVFLFFITAIALGCLATYTFAEDTSIESENLMAASSDSENTEFSTPLRWYREYISPIDGDRCPMTPSCSAYSSKAFRQHGLLMGWIMTCDRLMRCGRDETDLNEPVWTPDGLRCPDPLSDNDFWWNPPK